MKVLEWISAFLGFRNGPTSILIVLTYAAIFSAVLVTDLLPNIPKKTRGLDITQAASDLSKIAGRPHPYNSHANDLVRSYILTRVQEIASRYPHVHVFDDMVSNASFAGSSNYGIYFEGTNILVKIDGTDPEYLTQGGVLLSAHYDSVSTASGATDDGMGVTTLLQMVEYLAERRGKRTAVFNINNGEEDGLHGAHVFLEHPWSNITDTFLNLEGAAAGGRPTLFRATSQAAVRSFRGRNVPHPHGNVLSADAFARGIIRSGTDYSVYTKGLGAGGMEGLDFAFYRGRSMYHTKYDSIAFTEGGKKSLWAMMETVRGAGSALVNDSTTHIGTNGERSGEAVYFDLFASTFVIFSLNTLLVLNIVILVVGPVFVLLLIFVKHVVERDHRRQLENGGATEESFWLKAWNTFQELGWLRELWRWAKFWLAVVLTLGLQILLAVGYVRTNPFIVYSHPYLVFISIFSHTYLDLVLLLKIPIGHKQLPEQQKLTILIQTYILTWLFLLGSTVLVAKLRVGALYWITIWNALVFLGTVLGILEVLSGAHGTREGFDEPRRNISVTGLRYEVDENARENGDGTIEGGEPHGVLVETEPTEITPLIQQHRSSSPSAKLSKEEGGAIGWWILELLLVVPLPVILLVHILIILMGAMPQTLADGSSALVVYIMIAVLSFLLILPVAPFSVKMHTGLIIAVFAVFIITTSYNFLAFPFSLQAPLKVFFQQKIEIDLSTNASSTNPIHVVTSLTGVPKYLGQSIVPWIPSSWSQNVDCSPNPIKHGLIACSWETNLVPSPGNGKLNAISDTESPLLKSHEWIVFNASRLSPTSARFSVKGINSRSCRLYFDSDRIKTYRVYDSSSHSGGVSKLQPGYEAPEDGFNEVRLWSRTWDNEFTVEVGWNMNRTDGLPGDPFTGRVACDWVEYQSGTATGGDTGGRIPALEEVLAFLPKWAVLSKTTDGLVHVSANFTV